MFAQFFLLERIFWGGGQCPCSSPAAHGGTPSPRGGILCLRSISSADGALSPWTADGALSPILQVLEGAVWLWALLGRQVEREGQAADAGEDGASGPQEGVLVKVPLAWVQPPWKHSWALVFSGRKGIRLRCSYGL